MDLAGKTALVTGAAGGIGGAVVAALRARGARVAVADRDTTGIEADYHLPGICATRPIAMACPPQLSRPWGGWIFW